MSGYEQAHTHHAEVEVAGPESGASVDKVRDILFGSQIKQFETRFNRLEENLRRETTDLKETMRRRFESVEGFFKTETEALATRLRGEREERTTACITIDQDLKATHDAIGRQIHALDASTAEAQSGLRLELMAESRKLMDEIAERHETVRALIEYRIAELHYQKADRALLSTLLADLGSQLSDDSQIDAAPTAEIKSSDRTVAATGNGAHESGNGAAEPAAVARTLAANSLPGHILAKMNPGKNAPQAVAPKGRSTSRLSARRIGQA
jgi:hypothetical protein